MNSTSIKQGRPERVAEAIRNEILAQHKKGDQIDPVVKLARRFEVSINTVVAALAILAREGLVERRYGSGTFATGRVEERQVAVLNETDAARPAGGSYFFLRATQQILNFLGEHQVRYRLYMGLCPSGEFGDEAACEEFVKDVARNRISGVVALASPNERWTRPLLEKQVPVVGCAPDYSFGVGFDYPELVRRATRCLLEQGRRKVAYLGGAHVNPLIDSVQTASSVKAFAAALNEYGVQVQESWMRTRLNPCRAGAGWESFREIWLSGREKPDGLVVNDDYLCRDVAMAILELGIRVPEQLMVITHANRGSELRFPFPVIKLEFDPDAFAVNLGEILLKLMAHQPVEKPQVYLPFSWGDTVAAVSPAAEVVPAKPKRVRRTGRTVQPRKKVSMH